MQSDKCYVTNAIRQMKCDRYMGTNTIWQMQFD